MPVLIRLYNHHLSNSYDGRTQTFTSMSYRILVSFSLEICENTGAQSYSNAFSLFMAIVTAHYIPMLKRRLLYWYPAYRNINLP